MQTPTETVKQEVLLAEKPTSDSIIAIIGKPISVPKLERELNTIGAQSLKRAVSNRESMQVTVGDTLPSVNNSSQIATMIKEAGKKKRELHPINVKGRLLYSLAPFPFIRRKLVKAYFENFLSKSGKMQSIFDNLEAGKEALLDKMSEIEMQCRSLCETKNCISEDIILCNEVLEKLNAIDSSAFDELDKAKYDTARNKVAQKFRELETVKMAIWQILIFFNQTLEAQTQLNGAIDAARLICHNMLQNAIMFHSAASQQKEVALDVNNTQNAINDAMLTNAQIAKGNTSTLTYLHNNPVLVLDKFQESFFELDDAVYTTFGAQTKFKKKIISMYLANFDMGKALKTIETTLDDQMNSSESLTDVEQKTPGAI